MTDDDELLAAELAFGLIAGEERAAAEDRAASDPAFALAVARWQAHAAALASGAGESPRPSIWATIEARLPANDAGTPAEGTGRWRAMAIAASLLAGVMTVVAIERRPATPPPTVRLAPAPPLVAMLSGGGRGVIAVSYDPGERRMTLAATAFDPGHHSAELWVIPADKTPRSLGVIDPAAPRTSLTPGNAGAAMAAGVTLAISIEPIGGSPTGQPTGPVVLSGIMQKS